MTDCTSWNVLVLNTDISGLGVRISFYLQTFLLGEFTQPFEYPYDYSPAWRYSAQHMRWTNWLEELADWYVRQALNVELGAPTPLVCPHLSSLPITTDLFALVHLHTRPSP